MAQKIITQQIDLAVQNGRDVLMWPNVLAVKGDNLAHQWRVEVLENGIPKNISGQTVRCYAVNGGATTIIDGVATDNVASIVLISPCYANAGTLKCIMRIMVSGQTTAVAAMYMKVTDGSTDVLVDPDDIVMSLDEMLALIADMEAAEATRQTQESARQTAEAIRAAYYAGYNDEITRTRLWRTSPALSVAQITPVPSSPLAATVKTVATQAGSGDPSPSNIRAVSGKSSAKVRRSGKNLWVNPAAVTSNGITMTVGADGTVTLNGTATALFLVPYNRSAKVPAGRYTVSINNPVANANVIVRVYSSGVSDIVCDAVNKVSSMFVTPYLDACVIRVASGTVLSNFTLKVQVELGSVATAYEAYEGTELTLTPSNTLYGLAGVEDEIGADGHEAHNTAFIALDGTTAGKMFTRKVGLAQNNIYGIAPTSLPKFVSSIALPALVTSHFPPTTRNVLYSSTTKCATIFETQEIFLALGSDGVATLTEANAWLAAQYAAGTPVQVLYQLATPTTDQSAAQTLAALAQADKYTPRLNNLYSDGGNVVVGYAQHPSKTYDFLTEKTGYGVASGLIVSAQSTPNMTVAVSGGVVYMADGTRLAPLAVSALAINAADATNPRIDIVYLSSSGVVSCLAGLAAPTPVASTLPTGGFLLAEISVTANVTAITSAMITFKAQPLWVESPIRPTLVNGATHHSVTNDPVEYIRDVMGQVRLRGRIAGITIDATAFTLAVGYRPPRTTLFYANDSTGKVIVGYISLSGSVFVYASVGYTSYISLSGITFQTLV